MKSCFRHHHCYYYYLDGDLFIDIEYTICKVLFMYTCEYKRHIDMREERIANALEEM